jgi:hypothetical protein
MIEKVPFYFSDVILLLGATYNSGKVAGGGVDCQEKV